MSEFQWLLVILFSISLTFAGCDAFQNNAVKKDVCKTGKSTYIYDDTEYSCGGWDD